MPTPRTTPAADTAPQTPPQSAFADIDLPPPSKLAKPARDAELLNALHEEAFEALQLLNAYQSMTSNMDGHLSLTGDEFWALCRPLQDRVEAIIQKIG